MSDTTYKSKVGYQSPIKLNQTLEWEEGTADKISKYIAGEIDNLILESCMKVVCDVNEEELLKALQYDRGQYEKGYADGKRDAQPHWVSVEEPPKRNDTVLVRDNGYRVLTYLGDGRWEDDYGYGAEFVSDDAEWCYIEPPQEVQE